MPQKFYPSGIPPFLSIAETRPLVLSDDNAFIQAHRIPWVTDFAFNEGDNLTLAASAARTVIVSSRIPQGMLGILRWIGAGVKNAADWDNIRWAVEIGGRALPGLDNIVGPMSDLVYPVEGFVSPIYEGQTVRLVASNLTTTAITRVTGMIRGHVFPR